MGAHADGDGFFRDRRGGNSSSLLGALGADGACDFEGGIVRVILDGASLGFFSGRCGIACGGGSVGGAMVVRIVNPELRRVLILASALNNKHQTIMRGVRFKVWAGDKFVRARVVNRLGQRGEGLDVGARSAQEHERDGSLG